MTASGMLTIPNNNVPSRSEGANNITIEVMVSILP